MQEEDIDGNPEDRVRAIAERVVAQFPPEQTERGELLSAWFDAGLTWVHFPLGKGGLSLSRSLQPVADAILIDTGGVPTRLGNTIGYGIAAPTIIHYARPEIADRLLRPLASAREIWCQLFSEPGAGSDLANVSTSAVLEGDVWRINGQKVWSSRAHMADWGVLLARTDPSVAKHAGLTYFAINMRQPGVEVRPLRQMTGRAEFNETFLTDAAIPDAFRLGEVGDGWKVARTTLMNERMAIGHRKNTHQARSAVAEALILWAERRDRQTPVLRDRLAQLWVRSQAHRLTCERFSAAASLGQEASIAKVVAAELRQAAYEFCMDLLGPEGTRYASYALDASNDEGSAIQERFLRSRANTIEGGTSEIIRNIIGERLLGLPQEHRPDHGMPWRDARR